jgi:hypothetical protein
MTQEKKFAQNLNTLSTIDPSKTATITKSEIIVEKLPVININQNPSLDYVAIGSFILAILSFLITILVIKWNGSDQNNIAKATRSAEFEKWISNSRQNWINDLRNTISEFISTGFYMIRNIQIMHSADNQMTETDSPESGFLQIKIDLDLEFNKALRELLKHEFKVKLLLNKNESESANLIKAMNTFRMSTIYDKKTKSIDTLAMGHSLEKIEEHASTILSEEWKKTKKFNGLNNQVT